MFRIYLYIKFYNIKIKIIVFMVVFNKETDGLIYYILLPGLGDILPFVIS